MAKRTSPDIIKPRELIEWREARGYTQQKAADWFRVHIRTYQGWEAGRRSHASGNMIRISMAKAPKPRKSPTSAEPRLL